MSRTKHHRTIKNSLFRGMGAFKKVTRKKRKAKERIALQKQDYDNIPRFRKSDKWDYL